MSDDLGLELTTSALFQVCNLKNEKAHEALLESIVLCFLLQRRELNLSVDKLMDENAKHESQFRPIPETNGKVRKSQVYSQIKFPFSKEELDNIFNKLELYGYVNQLGEDDWLFVSKLNVANDVQALGYSFSMRSRMLLP